MRAAGRQSTLVASAFAMVLLIGNPARADIKGIRGRQVGNVKQFGLTVKPAHIVTPDGGSLLIWGFTAGLVNNLLALGGWERPWDAAMVIDL